MVVLASPYNFVGEMVNPNQTILVGQYGNLTGNGGYGWQTGSSSKDVETNGFAFLLNNGDGNALDYSGVIYGAGSVSLRSAPANSPCCAQTPLILSGARPNQYTGVTTLLQGVVKLAKTAGVTAIPGDLVMNNQGNNDELRWGASDQIADSANLTINAIAGKLNLNGYQETIHDLKMVSGASIDTGAGSSGQLTVAHFWYNNVAVASGTYTSANLSYIKGGGRLVVLSASAQPIKIMPLGDSITYVTSSYRGFLFTKLTQAGYRVDMVGTRSDLPIGGSDPDHEGHNGATIGPGEPNEWSEIPPYYSNQNDLYHLAPTFMAQNPDVILLLIGINDYTNYMSATGQPVSYDANAQSPTKLANLIDRILGAKPDVKIFVASLLPVSTAKSATFPTAPFNAAIPGIVAQRAAAGKQVYFVDLNKEAGIDPNDPNQLYDGLHPAQAGGQKIANVWYNHLVSVLGAPAR
ncbi:MAG: SGNH/GDSL hydrolase family protein [Caldilineaceae bacterium]